MSFTGKVKDVSCWLRCSLPQWWINCSCFEAVKFSVVPCHINEATLSWFGVCYCFVLFLLTPGCSSCSDTPDSHLISGGISVWLQFCLMFVLWFWSANTWSTSLVTCAIRVSKLMSFFSLFSSRFQAWTLTQSDCNQQGLPTSLAAAPPSLQLSPAIPGQTRDSLLELRTSGLGQLRLNSLNLWRQLLK